MSVCRRVFGWFCGRIVLPIILGTVVWCFVVPYVLHLMWVLELWGISRILMNSGLWILGAIITIPIVAVWLLRSHDKKLKRVFDTGVRASGTIIGVIETGIWVNKNPIVTLTIEVVPDDGSASYTRDYTKVVEVIHMPEVQPGSKIRMRISRDIPDLFVFDEDWGRPS